MRDSTLYGSEAVKGWGTAQLIDGFSTYTKPWVQDLSAVHAHNPSMRVVKAGRLDVQTQYMQYRELKVLLGFTCCFVQQYLMYLLKIIIIFFLSLKT